ncbi:lysophospholipase L1-like esterase [Neobacillus niacini]|uniref:SGNH/GDSL hydrolase family protein n=1 Tax=Neobacillus driksii TaxID=3035913 RepID=UPI0027871C20|nr:SGNH/GDSL hydrolase family protein [Neobacillus niacini]MDQ0973654.1 lysophospholipase L1-like esterase [Neobacillus niacini]
MKQIPLSEKLFHGAVSVEKTEDYMKPWRIPFDKREFFYPNCISGQAELPAGVRIKIRSNTQSIKIGIVEAAELMEMDCLIDGTLVKTAYIPAGETMVSYDSLAGHMKLIEIYLSQKAAVPISGIWIDVGAEWELVDDYRLRWITYGSSITHCYYSDSPSQTWPVLAAKKMDSNLTCLGYSGNCHLEPMVARMIRDLPADFISLCVGINIVGGTTLSNRTFSPALIGFIQTIRDVHKDVPLAIISPIFHREREKIENEVGLSLEKVRTEIVQVVDMLKRHGDQNIYYIDGLDMFGEEYEKYMPDGLHPNGEGDKIIAVRFQQLIEAHVPISSKKELKF